MYTTSTKDDGATVTAIDPAGAEAVRALCPPGGARIALWGSYPGAGDDLHMVLDFETRSEARYVFERTFEIEAAFNISADRSPVSWFELSFVEVDTGDDGRGVAARRYSYTRPNYHYTPSRIEFRELEAQVRDLRGRLAAAAAAAALVVEGAPRAARRGALEQRAKLGGKQ